MIESAAMQLQDAPHGLNIVVETRTGRVVIGRFDSADPFSALLHDCDVRDFAAGEDREPFIRETATYGIDVKQRDVKVDVGSVANVRMLRDIAKLA